MMLKSGRKINKEFSQGMSLEKKIHQLVEKLPLQEKNNRCIANILKRDFISQIYRDTGFICEA